MKETELLLKDKVAFITGAGSGIGRSTAQLFAAHGAKIICADINLTTALETVDSIVAEGGEAKAVKLDVSKSSEVNAVVGNLKNYFGRLDIAMICAGISSMTKLDDTSDELWDKIIGVNLTGTFYLLRALHPVMSVCGGAIINVSSTAAFSGGTGMIPAYAASKGGVCALTRHCARLWGCENIRVNTLMPSPVKTNFGNHMNELDGTKSENQEEKQEEIMKAIARTIPLGRSCEAIDCAKAALFLASDLSGYITGITLEVSGGRYVYGN